MYWHIALALKFAAVSAGLRVVTSSANITSQVAASLVYKYSETVGYLTTHQLQLLLDNVCNCTSNSDCVNMTRNEKNPAGCDSDGHKPLSAEDIFMQLNIEDGKLNETALLSACPLILNKLDTGSCGELSRVSDEHSQHAKTVPSSKEVWGYGFLAVTLISLCSLLGAGVHPLRHHKSYNPVLTSLVGLAAGSLASTAIFHLIPQAFGLVDIETRQHYLSICSLVGAGIWVFFLAERFIKVTDTHKQQQKPSCSFPCSDVTVEVVSSISSPTELIRNDKEQQQPLQQIQDLCSHSHSTRMSDPAFIYNQKLPSTHGRDMVSSVAWMVIFGDGLHNFIDGLSIGAAFSESILTGVSISLAVLCEELPHELGDFAVLLNSGMTVKQALKFNFLSACTCYIGLVVGIIFGEVQVNCYIFGFAAGMFLYISLADMIPEMNTMTLEACKVSTTHAVVAVVLQNMGIALGVVILYFLAMYQDNLNLL